MFDFISAFKAPLSNQLELLIFLIPVQRLFVKVVSVLKINFIVAVYYLIPYIERSVGRSVGWSVGRSFDRVLVLEKYQCDQTRARSIRRQLYVR